MNKILILTFLLTGCTSLKKSKSYGGIVGTFIGSSVGYMVAAQISPKSDKGEIMNKSVGLSAGALAGYFVGRGVASDFYTDDPENFVGPSLIMPTYKKEIPSQVELPKSESIVLPINQKSTTRTQ